MHRTKHAPHHDSQVVEMSYAGRDFREPVPKFMLPAQGMPADSAYQLVHDELCLDAEPSLNLASFVTTWMEPQARSLLLETQNKNLIDHEEYPQVAEIEQRVVSMMARLLHAPSAEQATGTSTIGSSEAIMLGLLAHKRSWQHRRKAQGKPTDKPNVIFGADAHTCLEKFACYFDVEARIAPLHPHNYVLSAADVASRIDENTIAVCCILGTTFTGQMDPIGEIDALLRDLQKTRGLHVPMHVDAASGGFIIPFTRPDLVWDFRVPSVRSINISNHKFGLVYPGMGTLLFRDAKDLPDELVFHINYLGGDMPNFSLNFSRPSSQVIGQYYNFLRLGHDGYTHVMGNIMRNARYLADQMRALGPFEMIGDGTLFPVVVACARDPAQLSVFKISEGLRQAGWVVPAYTLPKDASEISVLRMVVRESLSRDMVDRLMVDLRAVTTKETAPSRAGAPPQERKHIIC